jgi:hypothetical protein
VGKFRAAVGSVREGTANESGSAQFELCVEKSKISMKRLLRTRPSRHRETDPHVGRVRGTHGGELNAADSECPGERLRSTIVCTSSAFGFNV